MMFDPYKGRHKPRSTSVKEAGNQSLRLPSKGTPSNVVQRGSYDVRDGYLRGLLAAKRTRTTIAQRGQSVPQQLLNERQQRAQALARELADMEGVWV